MFVGDLIKEYRISHGLTQQAFADACGVSKSYISLLESGKSSRSSSSPIIPSIEVANRIASAMGMNMDELFGYTDGSQRVSLLVPPSSVQVPVLGRVAAGIPLEAVECVLDYEEIPAELARTGEFFGLQIKGDSMSPRILEGDVVIVRKQETCDTGDIAIVLVDGADATCKRVVFHESGLSLIGLNPGFAPRFYTQQEIETLPVQIIGKVVELRGKL